MGESATGQPAPDRADPAVQQAADGSDDGVRAEPWTGGIADDVIGTTPSAIADVLPSSSASYTYPGE